MSLNPCPKCNSSRGSLEEPCPQCGWIPARERGITNPIQVTAQNPTSSSWLQLVLSIAMGHLLLVAASYSLIPSGLFTMEASNVEFLESFFVYLFLILNVPLGFVGLQLGVSGENALLIPLIVANSFLWASAISLALWSLGRAQQFRKSVQGRGG